jgi:hypothetical protein
MLRGGVGLEGAEEQLRCFVTSVLDGCEPLDSRSGRLRLGEISTARNVGARPGRKSRCGRFEGRRACCSFRKSDHISLIFQ